MIEHGKRFFYIDVLRIIASFAVVLIHITANIFSNSVVGSTAFFSSSAYLSFIHFSVPVFVMISGSFFLDPDKEITIGKLFKKNILRLLLVFLIWSVIYAVYNHFFVEKYTPAGFLSAVVKGNYHMWFLIMLIGLYVITPLLRKITSDKKATEYLLVIAFIFSFSINFIKELGDLLVPHQTHEIVTSLFSGFSFDLGSLNWQFPAGYLAYYVAGFYISRYGMGKRLKTVIYVLMIPSVLCGFFVTWYVSVLKGCPTGFFSEGSAHTAILAIGFFMMLGDIFKKQESPSIIKNISECTLGIYMIHMLILSILSRLINFGDLNPVIYIPLVSLIVYIFSLLIIRVIKFIPIPKEKD